MKKKVLNMVTLTALTIGLVGCGGGGGGGTDSGGSSSLSFPTNSVVAEATDETAQSSAEAVTGSTTSMTPSGMFAVSNEENTQKSQIDFAMSQFKKVKFNKAVALNETISETETIQCSTSGSETYTYNMTGDENTGLVVGTMSMTSNNCNEYGSSSNGTMSVSLKCTVDLNNDELASCEYMNMSVGANGFTNDSDSISGNSSFNFSNVTTNSYGYSMRLTANSIVRSGTKQFGLRDFIIDLKDVSGGTSEDYVSGSVYFDSLLKYVTVDPSYDCTTTPLISNSWGDYTSGECRFLGANNSKIKLYAQSNKLMIAIDPEGDGSFEVGKEFNIE